MQTRSLYVRANAENIVPSYIVYYATIVNFILHTSLILLESLPLKNFCDGTA